MAVNYLGVSGIIVFYLVILIIGLWAARVRSREVRQRDRESSGNSKEVMLAGRNIGILVGAFTMTATWVGGGYINGTSEAVANRGLIWAQSPWGYSLSLIVGGFMFAKIMRRRGYVTLLDPFQERYGVRIGAMMYIPAFLGELLWSAATLNSLGATISVVLDLPMNVSVIASACIAFFYTFFGGLWSVAYTDVAQLICMFIGMWLTIPFAATNDAVSSISSTMPDWIGEWEWSEAGQWFDYALLLIFGGIPWQVYFQRVLSSKTHKRAQYLSFAAAGGCIIMAIPSVLIGAIGASTAWEETPYNRSRNMKNGTLKIDYTKIMPLVLQYLTPSSVSFVGLGAVSAAVMSSVDSSVLSASSMFAHNIYKSILRQSASENEMVWVIRVSIILVGTGATIIGLTVKTIYGLSILCSDLIYVILFPQLICVLYFRYSNGYGAICSFAVGMVLRILGGEKLLGIFNTYFENNFLIDTNTLGFFFSLLMSISRANIPFNISFGVIFEFTYHMPAVIKYPLFDSKRDVQRFPFRTLSMLITAAVLIISSIIVHILFERKVLSKRYDIANCFEGDIKEFNITDVFTITGVTQGVRSHENGNTDEDIILMEKQRNEHSKNDSNSTSQ